MTKYTIEQLASFMQVRLQQYVDGLLYIDDITEGVITYKCRSELVLVITFIGNEPKLVQLLIGTDDITPVKRYKLVYHEFCDQINGAIVDYVFIY